MKRTICTSLFLCSLAITACGAKEETKATEKKDATEEVITEDTVVNGDDVIISKYAYDKDWEAIKKTIIEKDIAELDAWINGANVDAENIIENCQTDFVLAALKKATYADLKTQEMDGEIYLVFYAEVSGMDDEGNEMGSSMTIYMSQGDPNLRIEYILAAG